jgi:type IV pilus assembly protein PilO
MTISFKEAPWYIQALVFVALAIVLLAAGEYTPGLPVANTRDELQALRASSSKLNQEVSALQVYERRYTEFMQEMNALNKQLDTLKTIVPEGKEVDEFMRLVQGAASASGVQVRHLTAQAVVAREYHFEMPFNIEVDGPYFSIVDFFGRLSGLSRIINVGDLTFNGLGDGKSKYPVRPNTSVTGSCVVTSFFTMPSETASASTPAVQPTVAGKPAAGAARVQ